MKIGLIGYGKMGKAIEEIALKSGHQIDFKISNPDFTSDDLKHLDVAIEFTSPEAAVQNIYKCFDANIPVVVGTTGWYDHFKEISNFAEAENRSLFYATNFSVGVNLFFQLNRQLAKLMNNYPEYNPEMFEAHHIQKKDAPSGTAITLAEDILKSLDRKNKWVHREAGNITPDNPFDLNIESLREGEIPGTHTITYRGEVDEIVITHQAFNRSGFARGAVKAAEWIVGKKGVYTMSDMMGFNN